MTIKPLLARSLVALLVLPQVAGAQSVVQVRERGVSALWVLANFSYAGMRAQDSASSGWRILAFICGFPGTLLTFLVVREGSERAYGVELPTHLTSTPPFVHDPDEPI
ncbi:MAG: hypothetical protein JWN79_528 [Gemmatimonadetes bacterium]|jgi:hypothetical protein|nr:hypothetical protein [Gemmatimonadota bacterium]